MDGRVVGLKGNRLKLAVTASKAETRLDKDFHMTPTKNIHKTTEYKQCGQKRSMTVVYTCIAVLIHLELYQQDAVTNLTPHKPQAQSPP
jgi:hypothetical protein